MARASYNWVWFPCWSIHPSHYAGNKKFMFDNDQNHCDNDNEIIWFPIGNTDTDMLRLPLLIIIEIFNYLVQQLTLEVEMNVSNSIHISFRTLVLADMYNINIQASASLSQSVLSYYTVLIHILYGQGYIIQVSILWLIEWVVCKTNHWLNLGQIKSEGFWLPTVLTSANGQPSDNLKTTHNNLW